jgi:hypothetical protein
MAEENLTTTPSGLAGAMQGMQFVRGSMGQYEPVAATKPTMGARELPEEWGGRPTGESRRAIRMQEEWDKQRGQQLEEMRLAQQMEMEQRRFALSERDQVLQERQEARLQAAEAKAQEEILKVSEQADSALNEVLGGFDPTGNPISGLDPDAPDYMQRRNDIIKRYPKALQDDAFKTTIATTDKSYFDTVNFNQQLKSQEESSGRIIERQIAAEERAAEKQRGIREEERKTQEERDTISKEREINKLLRQERQKLIEAQGAKASTQQQRDVRAYQNKLIDLEIEKADLRGLAFENSEAYQKAKDAGTAPPSGTIVYVGRKRVKVK